MTEFISQYGYLAIFLGTCFEGETAMLIGGFLAWQGYLNPELIVLVGFAGAWVGDQAWFYLGRWRGIAWLRKHPAIRRKSVIVRQWIRRNEAGVIIGLRFAYGLRSVTPYMLGAMKVSRVKFALLNMLGCALWAGIVGWIAISFGDVAAGALKAIKSYEKVVLLSLLGGAGLIWAWHWWSDWRKGRQFAQEHPEMVDPAIARKNAPPVKD